MLNILFIIIIILLLLLLLYYYYYYYIIIIIIILSLLLLLLLLFKHGQPVGSFRCERINTAKQKDGFTSFLVLSVLEVKIFQYQVS